MKRISWREQMFNEEGLYGDYRQYENDDQGLPIVL